MSSIQDSLPTDINAVLDELLQETPEQQDVAPVTVEQPEVKPTKLVAKKRVPSLLVVLTSGAVLGVIMVATAILVSTKGQQGESAENSLYLAEANMRRDQRALLEKLSRTDLNPVAITNAGWRQQAIAALSQSILNDAELARSNPQDANYRRSREAALHWQMMQYIKLANLAELKGNSTLPAAKLIYTDETGQTIEMSIPASELFAIALNRIEATIGAQQWREVPQGNLRIALSELMTLSGAYKEDYAAWLSQANLTDSAAQVREIQSWQMQQQPSPTSVIPPALPTQKSASANSTPKKKEVKSNAGVAAR